MAWKYEHMDKQSIIQILVKRDARIRQLNEQLDSSRRTKRRERAERKNKPKEVDTEAVYKKDRTIILRYMELEKQQDKAIDWICTLDRTVATLEGREPRTYNQVLDRLLSKMPN